MERSSQEHEQGRRRRGKDITEEAQYTYAENKTWQSLQI